MSQSKAPPTLPEFVDEAGDTPAWVPTLGAVLFGVIALIAASYVGNDDQARQAQQKPRETRLNAIEAAP